MAGCAEKKLNDFCDDKLYFYVAEAERGRRRSSADPRTLPTRVGSCTVRQAVLVSKLQGAVK